jgi:hypothetical protein
VAAYHLNFKEKKRMKKFIKSSLLLFTMLVAFAMSGCDSLQNFLFDLPIKFTIDANGASGSYYGSESYCLTNDQQYQDYQDKINSITYADAYFVTKEAPAGLSGSLTFQLLDENNNIIISYSDPNIVPAVHDSTNAYHLSLNQSQIDDINTSLANGNRCFTGVYSLTVNGNANNDHIIVDIEVLFTLDTKL